MIVETVDVRGRVLGLPELGHQGIEIVALRCTGREVHPEGKRSTATIWLPLHCPVLPGDMLCPEGDWVAWITPVGIDGRFMQADCGWRRDGKPGAERREAMAAGRA